MLAARSFLAPVHRFAEFVRFEHTVFALPFAYVGAIVAAHGLPSAEKLILITVAMVAARSTAMGLNRIIDREIDRRNPRTVGRSLPAGKLSLHEAWAFTAGAFGVLTLAAALLNPLCLALLPLATLTLVVYPYTKRFTWLCHWAMAPAQFFGPFGGYIAVTGRATLPAALLGAGVGLWIAGFDLIYALQDVEVDRREGLFSVPARLGVGAALALSRLTHVVAVGLLLAAGLLGGFGPGYLAGVALVAVLLAVEQAVAARGAHTGQMRPVQLAFFEMNGLISLGFLACVLVQVAAGWSG